MTRPWSTAEYREYTKSGRLPAEQAEGSLRLLSKAEAKIAKARPDLEGTLLAQIKLAGLPAPEREVRFHPSRRWRCDMAWRQQRVALDVQGGTYVEGKHSRGKGQANDAEKGNEAQLLGWLFLLATVDHVRSGQALGWIERALAMRAA